MVIKKRKTRQVKIGNVKIGGNAPVSIQSMAKTDTADMQVTVSQIKALEQQGCEIVRVAVKNMACARVLDKIKARIGIPIVADIHFHFQLALEAISRGVDGLRLNPGNIYRRSEIKQVVKMAKKKDIPIRVGVNSGSLRTSGKKKKIAGQMVKSALDYIKILNDLDFYSIIVSLKASDLLTTVQAYRMMAKKCDYPFHLGLTAAGPEDPGSLKSAIGLGVLLAEGIGDTIRVSLTADPNEEVKVARNILTALKLRKDKIEIVSCPTCGRCEIELIKIVKQVKKRLNQLTISDHCSPVKVAIMGCVVNGPGEARDADVGLAGGRKSGIIFRKGKIVKKVGEKEMVDELVKEILNPKKS
ncbi:MAG: flavodoxin-dependent (E)-4-hydroxy-3-methylbut-2-enyl-diphosphate synthase [Candidatus Omnitrophota bacterium]|nr:flavodoxin-dependent (E)-4-hydroxy-3-methylbut-2-enyl-diphosphate synthase [Candidatus Omnitrophota bacterium]